MAKILVLDDDACVGDRLSKILTSTSNEVSVCRSVSDAETAEANTPTGHFDLYICGPVGKYSDGLIFALDRAQKGRKVVIVANRRKFSRLPFLNKGELQSKDGRVSSLISHILTGGQ